MLFVADYGERASQLPSFAESVFEKLCIIPIRGKIAAPAGLDSVAGGGGNGIASAVLMDHPSQFPHLSVASPATPFTPSLQYARVLPLVLPASSANGCAKAMVDPQQHRAEEAAVQQGPGRVRRSSACV